MPDGIMAGGGWGMGAIYILLIVLLVLGIAAPAKYPFWSKG